MSGDLSTELERAAQPNEQRTITQLIERQKPEIVKVLGTEAHAERFTRLVLTECRRNPALLECSPESVLGAMMLSAQLGLEPGPLGHVYLVPMGGHVEFIIGYRGFVDLAYRSGLVKDIQAHVVLQGDTFSFRYGTRPVLDHEPQFGNEGNPPTHAYAVARLKSGGVVFEVIEEADWERAKSRSASGSKGKGPWITDTAAMIRKTAVRRLEPMLPKSAVFARALEVDEAPAPAIEDVEVGDYGEG